MNQILRELESSIIDFGRRQSACQGILLLSPTTEGRDSKYSVSRILVFLRSLDEAQPFWHGLEREQRELGIISVIDRDRLWARVFSKDFETFVRVDMSTLAYLQLDLEEVNIRPERLDRVVVYDPQDKIRRIVSRRQEVQFNLEDSARKIFARLVGAGYEFLRYWTLQDLVRAYEQYGQFLAQVGGLVLLSIARYKDGMQHRHVLFHLRKNKDLRQLLLQASSSIGYAQMIDSFYRAMAVVEKVVGREELSFLHTEFENFYHRIKTKFPPILNFRDVGQAINQCYGQDAMREGLLFRSALPDYNDAQRVSEILAKHNIRTIVSLIERNYWQQAGIEPLQIQEVDRFFIHIDYVPFEQTHGFVGSFDTYKNLYYGFLSGFGKEIAEAIVRIEGGLEKGAVLVHCGQGKDRTAVVIALLLMAIGIDRQCIIKDYLASLWDTRQESIEYLFELIDAYYGGIDNYLDRIGLADKVVKKLRASLLI